MKHFSKALIYTLFELLFLFSSARLVSASNLPSLSDKVYIACYPLNTTGRTYSVSAENRYIDHCDECYITAIDGSRVYVSYPTTKGRHSEWFNRDAFSVADLANATFPTITAPRKITTYNNAKGNEPFGYLDKGDECYVLTKTYGRTQLVYPVPNGYKMGWVDSGEIYEGTNKCIMSIHSALDISKVIDVDSGGHADGTNILLYSEHGGKNQGFEMIPVGKYFVIVNTESGKALDVQGGTSGSGVNVQLYTVNYTDAQLWETIESGDSKTYYLKSKLGYFLDICGGTPSDCTNIWVYEGNNSGAQKFKFKPLSETSTGNKPKDGNDELSWYQNNVGRIIANLSSYSTSLDGFNGIKGQCVWYVRNRAYEKIGVLTGIGGNANEWFNVARNKGFGTGSEPRTNSIACWNGGKYGHVVFIEYYDNATGTVYFTEANWQGKSSGDGVLQAMSVSDFPGRKSGYQGCIYLS